jgi:hypothetical protein
MATFGGLDRIDGERADGVGHDTILGEGTRQYLRLPCQRRFVPRNFCQTRHVRLFRRNCGVHKASALKRQPGSFP